MHIKARRGAYEVAFVKALAISSAALVALRFTTLPFDSRSDNVDDTSFLTGELSERRL